MPTPSSSTWKVAISSLLASTHMRMGSARPYLMAFDSRLAATCSIRAASHQPVTGWPA